MGAGLLIRRQLRHVYELDIYISKTQIQELSLGIVYIVVLMEGAGVSAKLKRAYGLHIGVFGKGGYFSVCNLKLCNGDRMATQHFIL